MKLVTDSSQYLETDYTFMPLDHGMDDMGDDRRAIANQSKENVDTLSEQMNTEIAIIDRLQGKLSSGRGSGAGAVGQLKGTTDAEKMDIHRQIVAHMGKLALLQQDYKKHQNFSNMAVEESYGFTDEQGRYFPGEDKTLGDFMKGDYAFNFLGGDSALQKVNQTKRDLYEIMDKSGLPGYETSWDIPNPLQASLYGLSHIWSGDRWKETNIPAIKAGLSYLDSDRDRTFTADLSDVPGSLFEIDLRTASEKDQYMDKYLQRAYTSQRESVPSEWFETRDANRIAAKNWYNQKENVDNSAMDSLEYLQTLPFRGTSILEMSDVFMPEDPNK